MTIETNVDALQEIALQSCYLREIYPRQAEQYRQAVRALELAIESFDALEWLGQYDDYVAELERNRDALADLADATHEAMRGLASRCYQYMPDVMRSLRWVCVLPGWDFRDEQVNLFVVSQELAVIQAAAKGV